MSKGRSSLTVDPQASGALGSRILSALASAERYNVSILVRNGSILWIPDGVAVLEVDYESPESLRGALQGQDVLISALGKVALALQPRLIDAAVAAGVQRIIPSEFGGDLRNPKTRQFPTYRPKVLVQEQLERLRTQSGISYTLIFTNCLLDWGLSFKAALLLSPSDRTIRLYDGGNVKFSTTTMATAGRAVVAVLDHYDETADRAVYVHDVVMTQNELLEMARAVTAGDGGKEWTASQVDTEELESEALSAFQDPGRYLTAFYGFAVRGAFGQGYGGHFIKSDNELLGVKEMEKSQVRALVRKILLQDSGAAV